ncbi:MAG: hypothetical protein J5859_02125, partial [Clostridia bacterium]|nr:hypothetical protein [Clostridia bacterium]
MLIDRSSMDPALTCMESAQSFNWSREGDRLAAISSGREIFLEKHGNKYAVKGDLTENEAIRFFDLDCDYEGIFTKAAGMKYVWEAYGKLHGLRLMNQPPWDTLLMFICSSNNNTRRIRSLVLSLCERFGTVRKICGITAYGLPGKAEMSSASVEELRAMKFGYRAEYLAKTALMIHEGFDLSHIAGLP